jgi:APA family basic amino acid/polyamine antiporter
MWIQRTGDPFLPNGFGGVLAGVSAVFYAYIGFDAISTTAEECKNPQRDLPRGMIYSLLICTVLYILIALVLTGMVHYSELKVNDPLAYVFEKLHLNKIGYLISVSAVVATTSVLLVFQLGQPRIWMSMSRDGLLPKRFQKCILNTIRLFRNDRYRAYGRYPSLFVSSSTMTDLTSIGTLFAFVLVCFGVLMLPKLASCKRWQALFRLPYINGKFLIPLIVALDGFLIPRTHRGCFNNVSSEGYQEIFFLVFMLIATL